MTATLELLDPSTLLVDRNIRDAHLDKPFLASIKEHGVLVPIVAVRSDADVRVRYGHRRTLAAVEAGTTTVPVVIVGDEDDDTIARIVGQWTENEHRSALTTSERIGAVHQLALLGLSAGQIARRTKSAKDDVGAALLAGASELATKAAARYDYLDLDQSAALAEFEGDDEAVTAPVVAAKDGRVHFDRAIDAAREKSEERTARTAAADALFAAGCALIDRPAWESAVTALTRLTDAEGSELTQESHEQCAGHAAWPDADWARAVETPEGTDDDDDATWVRTYLPVYVCVDPVALGHLGGRQVSSTSIGRDDSAATEAAKLARRVTIANNKAWREAEPIRSDVSGSQPCSPARPPRKARPRSWSRRCSAASASPATTATSSPNCSRSTPRSASTSWRPVPRTPVRWSSPSASPSRGTRPSCASTPGARPGHRTTATSPGSPRTAIRCPT